MEFWFILLLGLATYLMVQYRVARITQTPVWLLWLVLMIPAFVWIGWTLVYGAKQPVPPTLIFYPSVLSLLSYFLLLQWGRKLPKDTRNQTSAKELVLTSQPPPESVSVRPIEQTEEVQLRNCFPWNIYYVQNIEYRPQAVICKGHLRSTPSTAYEQIKANIEAQFGDRFLVIFQEGINGKPIFVLVPNTRKAKGSARPILSLFLLLVTLLTTTLVGAVRSGVIQITINDISVLWKGLPYALGLITILGIHELGHYLTAKFYKIPSTLPYFIPVPFFLGTFGAFIQINGPMPNRKALFDVSIAGPIAGFIATLPILLWGLAHSHIVPLNEKAGLFDLNALNPKCSTLLALLSKLALGSELTLKSSLDLHPVAVAGFLGLVVTALNLMPVGQLDGGHIVHAMFGQRTAVAIGQVARFLLLLFSFIQEDFFWWALILLFAPIIDEPALNDVTELDDKRDFLGLLAMTLLLLIILPLPGLVAHWLKI